MAAGAGSCDGISDGETGTGLEEPGAAPALEVSQASLEPPGMVEGVLAHGMGGNKLSSVVFPTQTILGFCRTV